MFHDLLKVWESAFDASAPFPSFWLCHAFDEFHLLTVVKGLNMEAVSITAFAQTGFICIELHEDLRSIGDPVPFNIVWVKPNEHICNLSIMGTVQEVLKINFLACKNLINDDWHLFQRCAHDTRDQKLSLFVSECLRQWPFLDVLHVPPFAFCKLNSWRKSFKMFRN